MMKLSKNKHIALLYPRESTLFQYVRANFDANLQIDNRCNT